MYERYELWEPGKVPLYDPEKGSAPYIETALLETGLNNPCVVVVPGGAYVGVASWVEGYPICALLNAAGYSAVMLNYRVKPYGFPTQLTDLKRAIRFTRAHAKEWNIDPEHVGVIGFSAGGHLAMTGALAFDEPTPDVGDEIDAFSARPDNAALCYGVCSLDPEITHAETRRAFLNGKEDDEALAFRFSGENMVRPDAPPLFLWHTAEDKGVDPRCSIRFVNAFVSAGIPVTFHLFPYGPHGIGLGKEHPPADEWGRLYTRWLDILCR